MTWASRLPRPKKGSLTLYLGGPGVGESQALCFPDGRWMIVDFWKRGKTNFPLTLCQEFGVNEVALAVVTHPDVDHIKGLPEFADSVEIQEFWRYPSGTLRDLLSGYCRLDSADGRLVKVYEALEVMDDLAEQEATIESDIRTEAWPTPNATYSVKCIAPCQAERASLRSEVFDIVQRTQNGGVELSAALEDFLLRESNSIRPRGNPLSLALAIEWEENRILLAGDVENGSNEKSGWSGVLRSLCKYDRLQLVTDVDVIKVAHHGSDGAYHSEVWDRHTSSSRSSLGLITPKRGPNDSPPQSQTLRNLRKHVNKLAVTAFPRGQDWQLLENAGWNRDDSFTIPAPGNWIAVQIETDGQLELTVSSDAGVFVS